MSPLQEENKVILLDSAETAAYIGMGLKKVAGYQKFSVEPKDLKQGEQVGVGAVFFETVELASAFFSAIARRTGFNQFTRPSLNEDGTDTTIK